MKGRILQGETCSIDAVGAEAQSRAVKAMVFTSRYLQDTHPGLHVFFEPEAVSLPAQGDAPETKMLRLHACLLPEPTAVEKADIVVSRETNPGLTAAEIARTLRARGRQGVVSISGMGPVPMNRALKAIVLARRYMEPHFKAGESVLAGPAIETLQAGADGGEDRVRFLLSCVWGPRAIVSLPNANSEE
ncbi:unnamed protein product [Polarella glacialis]|nr:unnamed protein product [Polarella glacialis]